MSRKSNAPVKLLWNSTIKAPTLDEVRAAQRKPKPAKKSRPKKPAWLLPKASKSQAQIDRDEDLRKYGPPEFRDFLHAYRCLGCGYKGEAIQQAHIHCGGKGRKDDYHKTGPLCGPREEPINVHDWHDGFYTITGCHHDYDHAKQSWPASRGIDIEVEQDRFWSDWEDHCETIGIDP